MLNVYHLGRVTVTRLERFAQYTRRITYEQQAFFALACSSLFTGVAILVRHTHDLSAFPAYTTYTAAVMIAIGGALVLYARFSPRPAIRSERAGMIAQAAAYCAYAVWGLSHFGSEYLFLGGFSQLAFGIACYWRFATLGRSLPPSRLHRLVARLRVGWRAARTPRT